jgi:predicted DNA-binding transcriptional regulator YafY
MSTTAARLITLIMLLQRQPEQKVADLAEKLGVSVRTLHRYFGMLEEMGVIRLTPRSLARPFQP